MRDIPEEDHTFWVFGEAYIDERCTYLKPDNIKYYPRIEIKMNKKSTENELQRYDLIIYHGVFEDCIIEYFYLHKELLKKLILYFWGGDKEKLPEDKRKRRAKVYVVRKCRAVATIIPQDYTDLKKQYHLKVKHFCAMYYSAKEIEGISKAVSIPKPCKKSINIQIGNSATLTNNHFEVLKNLSRFKEENINIFIPLSYGNMEYAERVVSYGKEIFGDKFIPVQNFMSLDEYCRFLYNMDIAIFDMKRQQALGNILMQMRMGCKIYLNRESLLWDYFTKDLECIVSNTADIKKINIKKLVEFTEKDRALNKNQIYKKINKEESIKAWRKMFRFL